MTAVEWLQNCLNIHFTFEQKMQFEGLFQQAKEMEKQQIIDAHLDGQCFSTTIEEIDYAKDYYNETYNK